MAADWDFGRRCETCHIVIVPCTLRSRGRCSFRGWVHLRTRRHACYFAGFPAVAWPAPDRLFDG